MHYHNDKLFTGQCGGNDYENGVISSGCFVAGSQVLMMDGTLKNIEDISVGEKVMSYNRKTEEYYVATVIKTTVEVVNAYFEIKLEDGTIIRLTGNHPILTDKGYENIFGIPEEDTFIVESVISHNHSGGSA